MKYRHLGNSGLLVSRACLGTMTFGQEGWGCDRQTAFKIVNRFIDVGGNFIDTADVYVAGASERILGEALREHKRDDIVLASKCYFRTDAKPNAKGLSRKHMIDACEASLKRLGVEYLDLYQLHGPDPCTPIAETLRSMDDLVRRGLVRYVGLSNFYAWQLTKANMTAATMGLETFCSGQYLYNLLRRDIEREILPACADQGLGVMCWGPLASGMLTGKYAGADKPAPGTRVDHRSAIDVPRFWNEDSFRIINEVSAVGGELDRTPAQVALAWLLHDPRVTCVILGATKLEQLESNLEVGDWDLPDEAHERLSSVVPFAGGYPQEWIDLTYPNTFNDAEFRPGGQG
jgi:aryl-alcohol dehydrogenase-like predicted oxidoreductase